MEKESTARGQDDFAERLAAATPTPGGGAAAARVGLYACSLMRMVIGITLSKLSQPKPLAADGAPASAAQLASQIRDLQAALVAASALGKRFQALETEDMAAFQSYLDALRLPRATPEEKAARLEARRSAAARATDAPLETMRAARDALLGAKKLLELSRSTPLKAESDLGAAVELALAASRVAALNVRVNLPELADAKRTGAVADLVRLESEIGSLHSELAANAGSS